MNIGLVFGIIFAIIVIIFITAFVVPLIMDTACNQEQLQISSAVSELEQKVNNVYFLSAGSIDEHTLIIPGSVNFCFVDHTNPGTSTPTWIAPNSAVQKLISDQMYDVYYSYCKGETGKSINRLSVDQSFCVEGSGRIYLKNEGTYVGVSRA